MPGTRLAPPRVPSGRIAVQPPPELTPGDGVSSLLSSMLPMLGSIGAIVMVTISNAGPTGFITGGMFLLSSLGFVAVNGWRQRSQRQTAILSSRREYLAYLGELRQTVRTAAKQQRRAANWLNPPPSALPYLAEDRTRVWERPADDLDFMSVRVGVTDQPLCVSLDAPELPPLAQLDPVSASAAHRFMLTHETQKDLPYAVSLRDYSRVEVTGDEAEARSLVRAILVQAATMHDPENLQIVVAADAGALANWEWVKWMPHAHSRVATDGLGPARMIGTDLADLEAMLPADLGDRPRFAPAAPARAPHVLIVTDGVRIPAGDPILSDEGVVGVTVIDLPSRWGDMESSNVLRINFTASGNREPSHAAELLALGTPAVPITADTLSIVEAEATARRLLPLYAGAASTAGDRASTKQAELVDLLGLPDVRDIDFASAWRGRLERDRLRVPIGQTGDGAPIILDIKEAAQQGMGPHGLIIGATGSGKSEVLRTLVLGLAMTHSPEQLNFVLVDFKGGATFNGMAGLPHVSAIITNLGDEISLVDRMQDALQGEMTRRQELLRSAGNFANVSDYEKARRAGRTDLAPLPALLIVADEFSELLSANPEFVDNFVAIGRLGRSLQVHLLLSSQRLEEGKLRGLDTYLSYRIGLRTFSAAESRTVLGVPDAYNLPQEPGYGYLKSDTETMTQFRAAYVSGPPPRRRVAAGESRGPDPSAQVELVSAALVWRENAADTDTDTGSEIEVSVEPVESRSTFGIAVERMAGLGTQAHRIWLPPLEVPPSLDQLMPDIAVDPTLGLVSQGWRNAGSMTVPLGMVDVPLEQRRESLTVSLGGATGHMAIVGGPLSGKSTLTRTTVMSLALTRTPLEVQFYVIDFGGGSFSGMTTLPHLAGLATRSEPDAVRRTIAEVAGILNAREQYFRVNGIDSIETYRQRRAAGTVDDGYGDVFLVIDGIATLRSEFESFEPAVQALAARGLTYGIHLIVTAARWIEIRPALKDLIGTRLELRLGEPSDSEIDRKAAANVPASAPGRGLSPRRLHMLGALPRVDGSGDPASLSTGVDDLIARMTAAWPGPVGPKLRLLPELITLDDVRDRAPEPPAASKLALLGVDETDLAPFGIDLLQEPLLYLFGDADSGKSSMLRTFAHEVMRLYGPKQAKFFLVDYRRALLGEVPDDYLYATMSNKEMVAPVVDELVTLFRGRLPGPDVTPEQLRTRSWWTGAEGFVLVDDYDLVATSGSNPLAPLAPLLSQAADVGLHVVLTRRVGGVSRAYGDPILQQMTDTGATGILLSGSPEEGALIGKVKAVPALPGRAQVISRDRGTFQAQLAYVPPKYS
ncbi:type VII secretion protein EccC [soil metagenome]